MTNSVYEIYTETAEGIMGKFSLRNDTLTLYHDFQLGFSDSQLTSQNLIEKILFQNSILQSLLSEKTV